MKVNVMKKEVNNENIKKYQLSECGSDENEHDEKEKGREDG